MGDIRRALDLWIEITGFDPEESKFRIGDYDIYKINQELKESLELDPSTILTMLLLDYYTEQYLNNRNFSVNSILADFDALTSYLAKSKELYSILRSNEIQILRKDFESHMLIAMKQYGEVPEAVINTIKNPHDLAFLRRDALKSFETLEVSQFSQGKADGRTPKFLEDVYEFWNINSLIRMVSATNEAFISVNLIRDPDYYNSYFTFAMKNGETLSIISDKPNWIHPLQKNMVRKPERDFAKRVFKSHFPYALMELEYDEDQRALYLHKKSDSTEVVPFQEDVHKLKKIRDLPPYEVIWITMMFQLIHEKFWKQDFKTKDISYTGAMVTVNPDKNKELILPNRLVVPAYSAADVNPETTKDQWNRKPTNQNEWMEKRYEGQIPDSVLTLTGVGNDVVKYITADDVNSVQVGSEKEISNEPHYIKRDKPKKHMLTGISPTEFGTSDRLLRDMQWNARYNKAKAIQVLVDAEYEKRQEEIKAWYAKRVKINSRNLLKAVAHGKLEAYGGGYSAGFKVNPDEFKNIMKFSDKEFCSGSDSVKLHQGFHTRDHYLCFINGCKASIAAFFYPTTAHGLAAVCGCKVDDLPDVLRHWRRDKLYSGNSILDRLDPMEWAVEDPWKKYWFEVVIYLSLSGYRKLCKEHGTEPKAKMFTKGYDHKCYM